MLDKVALENDLENATRKAYIEVKEQYRYNATLFIRKLSEKGAFRGAIELIQNSSFSSGFTKVAVELKRPDLTIEAIVLSGPWKLLFPESILDAARKKLKSINYAAQEYQQEKGEDESTEWSNEELSAAVSTYMEMLQYQRAGEIYNKAELNRALREGILNRRSKGSIEFRMQNISAVLEELGLDWVEGYKPLKNIGERVKNQIREILYGNSFVMKEVNELSEPTSSEELLNERVKKLLRTELEKPEGVKSPKKTESTSTVYYRDPLVKAWVLKNATGICESCGKKAPFITKDGTAYLEVHHIKPLADGGTDKVENAIAVCPNCHKKFHFSKEKNELIKKIYTIISRLVQE